MKLSIQITISGVRDAESAEPYLNDIRDILDEMKDNEDAVETSISTDEL